MLKKTINFILLLLLGSVHVFYINVYPLFTNKSHFDFVFDYQQTNNKKNHYGITTLP